LSYFQRKVIKARIEKFIFESYSQPLNGINFYARPPEDSQLGKLLPLNDRHGYIVKMKIRKEGKEYKYLSYIRSSDQQLLPAAIVIFIRIIQGLNKRETRTPFYRYKIK
jgi:hypothetical protein